jgi:putative transposase
VIFHVINRGARKGRLFECEADYQAFEMLLAEALQRFGVAIFAYCLMPNHWHFVIAPADARTLSRCMHWLTTTHARRWSYAHGAGGDGAVYQGRFRAIPVAADAHFLWVCRYVERNACRASLVERPQDWKWSSLWQRRNNADATWLSAWPVPEPRDWIEYLESPQTEAELEAFRESVRRGRPFGDSEWRTRVLGEMGLLTKKCAGRPRRKVSSKKDSRPHS